MKSLPFLVRAILLLRPLIFIPKCYNVPMLIKLVPILGMYKILSSVILHKELGPIQVQIQIVL